MNREDMPANLIILSLTVGLILVGWGALLSPPFESIRNALNIQTPSDGRAVMVGGQDVAAICNPDPAACQAYLSRLVFLYHSVFAIVLAMVVYAATAVFDFMTKASVQTISIQAVELKAPGVGI